MTWFFGFRVHTKIGRFEEGSIGLLCSSNQLASDRQYQQRKGSFKIDKKGIYKNVKYHK